MTTATQSDAVAFFREHAGFSYDAKRETAEQGRERCARDLATAEAAYRADSDVFVVWQVDETVDSSFFDSETEPHALYCALLCSEVDRTDSHGIEHPRSGEILVWDPETFSERSGRVIGSLGGIDFGADGNPYTDPYARVVVAELYAELQATREANTIRGEN